jgi:transcriptional regulator with XRE-family HTH domain
MAAGVSQKNLAELAGISPSHLARVETGERDTSQRVIEEISNTLGIEPQALITEAAA